MRLLNLVSFALITSSGLSISACGSRVTASKSTALGTAAETWSGSDAQYLFNGLTSLGVASASTATQTTIAVDDLNCELSVNGAYCSITVQGTQITPKVGQQPSFRALFDLLQRRGSSFKAGRVALGVHAYNITCTQGLAPAISTCSLTLVKVI